jgi:hypothetical protein
MSPTSKDSKKCMFADVDSEAGYGYEKMTLPRRSRPCPRWSGVPE